MTTINDLGLRIVSFGELTNNQQLDISFQYLDFRIKNIQKFFINLENKYKDQFPGLKLAITGYFILFTIDGEDVNTVDSKYDSLNKDISDYTNHQKIIEELQSKKFVISDNEDILTVPFYVL